MATRTGTTDAAFLTPIAFWQKSGLPRDEVYRRLHSGELPSLVVNGRFKIPARALDRLVDQTIATADAPADATTIGSAR